MPVLVKCQKCSVLFKERPSHANRRKFCSDSCKHASMRKWDDFDASFWKKVRKTRGCWLFHGTSSNGYGVVRIMENGKQKTIRAHRYSWEVAHGRRAPSRLMVRHKCHTPACVNPRHLLLGNHRLNFLDSKRDGRIPIGEDHPQSRMTNAQAAEARKMYASGGVSLKKLGKIFGLNASCCWKLVHGISYTRARGPRL